MTADREVQAAYIADMCRQLAKLANKSNWPLAASLLTLAAQALR
jgi:hypothetical protein